MPDHGSLELSLSSIAGCVLGDNLVDVLQVLVPVRQANCKAVHVLAFLITTEEFVVNFFDGLSFRLSAAVVALSIVSL